MLEWGANLLRPTLADWLIPLGPRTPGNARTIYRFGRAIALSVTNAFSGWSRADETDEPTPRGVSPFRCLVADTLRPRSPLRSAPGRCNESCSVDSRGDNARYERGVVLEPADRRSASGVTVSPLRTAAAPTPRFTRLAPVGADGFRSGGAHFWRAVWRLTP